MEDLQARREARRRKILENSENRLRKITSVNSDDKIPTENSYSYIKTESSISQTSSKATQQNPIEENASNYDDIKTIYENPMSNDDDESTTDIEIVNFDQQRNFMFRKWIIVILALVTRYLYLLTEQYAQLMEVDLVIQHLHKIFLPFFLYEIIEFSFFKPPVPQSDLLNILFMLNMSIRAENIQKIITLCRISLQILQNFMVYFFAFVWFDQIIVLITQEN